MVRCGEKGDRQKLAFIVPVEQVPGGVAADADHIHTVHNGWRPPTAQHSQQELSNIKHYTDQTTVLGVCLHLQLVQWPAR